MNLDARNAAFEDAKEDARRAGGRRVGGGFQLAPRARHVVEKGRSENVLGAGPFGYGLLEGLFVRKMEPPPRFRFRAPAAFAPASEMRRDDALAALLAPQDDLKERLVRAEGLDLRRLWQARQVKADPRSCLRTRPCRGVALPSRRAIAAGRAEPISLNSFRNELISQFYVVNHLDPTRPHDMLSIVYVDECSARHER